MDGARAAWCVRPSARLDYASLAIYVVQPHPIDERVIRLVLVASRRHDVEDVVCSEELLAAAPESRKGVADVPRRVFEEDAVARAVFQAGIDVCIVAEGTAPPTICSAFPKNRSKYGTCAIFSRILPGSLFGREGDVEVVAQRLGVGRKPQLVPP